MSEEHPDENMNTEQADEPAGTDFANESTRNGGTDTDESTHHDDTGAKHEEDDEEYFFMKETVRKRPVKIRKVIAKILAVVVFACLFGAVAGFIFLRVTGEKLPVNSESPVSLGRDEEVPAGDAETGTSETGDSAESSGTSVNRNMSENSSLSETAFAKESVSETASDGKSAAEHSTGSESRAASENGTGSENRTASENGAASEHEEGAAGASEGSGNSFSENHTDNDTGNDTGGNNEAAAGSEEELEQSALEEYQHIHAAMKSIAEEAELSVVQVTGITDTEDWFSNTETALRSSSGMIVAETDSRVLILTYGENILDSGRIAVTFPDGSILSAKIVKSDPVTGFSVISVDADDVTEEMEGTWQCAELGNSYDVRTGDSVIAIGSPLGYSDSVVYGEVTSVDGSVPVVDGEYRLITTNCLGSSSGSGILVSMDGEIVGVLDPKYTESRSSVVTAIPISLLKPLIEKLSNNEALGYIGITGETVPEELKTDGTVPGGIYLTSVDPDSPALSAGLLPGDILQSIGDTEVTDMWQVHSRILSSEPGDRIEVKVMRSGADGYVEFEFTVTVGELS